MFLSVITKNFTFKRWDGVKDEKFEYYRVHWKIRYLGGGGGHEKPIHRGDCLKRGGWRKRWGVKTPVHTIIKAKVGDNF